MKYDITDAILELKPGAVWTLSGDNYIGLTWLDSKQNKPTEEEIDNKISELHDSEAMRLLRIERNKKLSECDWRVLADVLQSSKFKEWSTVSFSISANISSDIFCILTSV